MVNERTSARQSDEEEPTGAIARGLELLGRVRVTDGAACGGGGTL